MTPFFSIMLVMETMKLQTQHGPSSTEPYLLVCPSFLDQIAKPTTIVGQNHHDCCLNYQLLIFSGCPTNKQRLIAYSPRQYTPQKKTSTVHLFIHPNTLQLSKRRFLRLIPLQMFHRRPQRCAPFALLRRTRVKHLDVRVATRDVRKVVDVDVVPFLARVLW